MQEFPAFCFYIAFAAKCRKGIFASRMVFRASKNVLFLLFNSAPSAEAKGIVLVQQWMTEAHDGLPRKMAINSKSHPLSCEFFQASQFPLGSPTFSQSPFEVVHFWHI